MIKDNVSHVWTRIVSVCQEIGRDPDKITLIGATKYATPTQIREAVGAGLHHIGENRVQEAREKFSALDEMHVKVGKHMIGHLQTNKVKEALGIFDMIQSVDSIKLVEEIEKQAGILQKQVDILVEVNTSGEEQKFGVKAHAILPLIDAISNSSHIRLCGLMTMAALTQDKERIRRCFRDLRELHDALEGKYEEHERIEMQYLSMGMTDDYEIALEEGANMVRVGRGLFK